MMKGRSTTGPIRDRLADAAATPPAREGSMRFSWILLLSTATLLGSTPAADGPRVSRRIPFGEVELPVYSPAWAAGEPLERIASALAENNRGHAQTYLDRMLGEWNGALLLTRSKRQEAAGDATSQADGLPKPNRRAGIPAARPPRDPWLRLPPPWETLAEWHRALPEASGAATIARPADEPLRAVNAVAPELWYPPLRARALRDRSLALARGDLRTAWLLDRAWASPGALDVWLAPQRATQPRSGPWRESFPNAEDALRHVDTPPLDLFLLSRHPLELARNRDRFDPTTRESPEHPLRRTPLGAIFPLIHPHAIVLATGSDVFAVSTSRPPRVLWSIESRQFDTDSRPQPALFLPPVVVSATDRYWAFLVRTGRDEVSGHPSKHFFDRRRGIEQIGFNRLIVAAPPRVTPATDPDQDPTISPPSLRLDVSTLLEPEETVIGKPLIRGDHVTFATVRGLQSVELSIVSVHIPEQTVTWRRPLAVRGTRWIASQDLRGLIPEIELVEYAGEILISSDFGFLARLESETGHVTGVQFFPQFDEIEHRIKKPTRNLSRLFGMPFPKMPPPRKRFPGPGIVVERPGQGPRWIVAPPHSLHLIAIDLDSWRVAWKLPIEPQCQILGWVDQNIALLDSGIEPGAHHLGFRLIDPDGRHLRFVDLELSVAESKVVGGVVDPEGPLLNGMPRLIGSDLWVPTVNALEVFELSQLTAQESRRGADRVLPWPHRATGGTPYPIPGGKIVTVGRGDKGQETLGYLEIFSTQ